MHMIFFFFNDTATTEIYTLSLHDALPICQGFDTLPVQPRPAAPSRNAVAARQDRVARGRGPRLTTHSDRKSTRLNSSHANISYAVFCLKKKNYTTTIVKFIFTLACQLTRY